MSVTKVRTGSASGTTTAPQVVLAAAPAQNNLLVAFVISGSLSAHTDVAANGYTKLTQGAQGNAHCAIYWKIAGAGESATQNPTTLSVSIGWACFISEWSSTTGFDANPVLAENAQSVASTTAYTTPSLSPIAKNNCIVVTGYQSTGSSKTWTSEAVSGTNVSAITEDGDVSSSAMATGTISATSGSYQGSATQSGAAAAGDSSIAIFFATQAAAPARNIFVQLSSPVPVFRAGYY